jgi:hypothetical protein
MLRTPDRPSVIKFWASHTAGAFSRGYKKLPEGINELRKALRHDLRDAEGAK